MPDLRPDEVWARDCISFALGVPVGQHDDGSQPSMHDLRIEYPDRPDARYDVYPPCDEVFAALHLTPAPKRRW